VHHATKAEAAEGAEAEAEAAQGCEGGAEVAEQEKEDCVRFAPPMHDAMRL
jgi:hypothetical protein